MALSIPLLTAPRRLLGALRSGDRAARRSVARTALRPLTALADRALSVFVRAPRPALEDLPPCLMLVAPPRSGATMIYQALTQTLPCVYPSNLHYLLPRTASHWMHRRGSFGRGIAGMSNYYGHTAALNDVNEANGWTGWVLAARGGPAGVRRRFLEFVRAMRPRADCPLVWKNVGAYDQLPRLIEAVPELCFLRVRRELRANVESELRGFRDLGNFNPLPAAMRGRRVEDAVAFAVEVILTIEAELDRAAALVRPAQWDEWTYEAFCGGPLDHVQALARERYPHLLHRLRVGPALSPIRRSQRQRVSGPESERIARLLAERGHRVA